MTVKRELVIAVALLGGPVVCQAQSMDDLANLQFHGYATQSFVASNDNNYLSMDTSHGSFQWTEAALNISDQLNDRLRIGMQFHYLNLGQFGADNVSIDWALGDFKINRYAGLRAGKVKIRWGLYNDTQDADPGYMWSLLPESIYGIDLRATNLSQMGAELYGKVPLGKNAGSLLYSGYYGDYYVSPNDGYMESYRETGITFTDRPWGKTPGFDLRWKSPLKGLMVAGSLMLYDEKGTMPSGKLREPLTYWPTYYAQYEAQKFFLSAQYMKLVQYTVIQPSGGLSSSSVVDERAWFAMGGYHVTEKFQVGSYYSHYLVASAGDASNPANYSKDWVASGRYDITSNFYGKLEGHFIDGEAAGFYGIDNPNGLKPQTRLVVAKVGFVF